MKKAIFLYPHHIDDKKLNKLKRHISRDYPIIEEKEIALGHDLDVQGMFSKTMLSKNSDIIFYEQFSYPYIVSCLTACLVKYNHLFKENHRILFINDDCEVQDVFHHMVI